MIISKREYYQWYSPINQHLLSPHDRRRFLNQDFLKSEQKRINKNFEWKLNYKKVPEGGTLEEIEFYILPMKLSIDWQEEIRLNNLNFKGLSALHDDLHCQMILLIPKEVDVPEDYSLIKIISSKKKIILNKKLSIFSNLKEALIVEKWEPIKEIEKIYIDIPTEKKLVSKILIRALGDVQIANSIQAPILSAPGVINSYKGISHSAQTNDEMALDLMKITQRMLPWELRTAKTNIKPIWREELRGIHYYLSENHPISKNVVHCFLSTDYSLIDKLNEFRLDYPGEYSFFSPFIKNKISKQLITKALNKFACTDITSNYIERLKQGEYLLPLIEKEINEDLHINIINYRQIRPRIEISDNESSSFQKKIEEDWEPFLLDFGHNDENAKVLSKIYAKKSYESILRISQSIARGKLKEYSDSSDINEARKIFQDNINDLWEQLGGMGIKEEIKKQGQNVKVNAIMGVLGGKPLSEKDIYDEIGSNGRELFKDFSDFLKLIGWMEEKHQIYRIGSRGFQILS